MVEMQAFGVLVCNAAPLVLSFRSNATEICVIQNGHKKFKSAYRNAQNKRRRKRKLIKQKVRNTQRWHLSV